MSDDHTKITHHAGPLFSAELEREQYIKEGAGLVEETSAVQMAVRLQDQVREEHHLVVELREQLREQRESHQSEVKSLEDRHTRELRHTRVAVEGLKVRLASERREHKKTRRFFEEVLRVLPMAVDVWSAALELIESNGGALRVLLLTDDDLTVEDVRELQRTLGPIYDEHGRELPPEEWPLMRALRGEVVEQMILIVRGVRIYVWAYPVSIAGEPQQGAVVLYDKVPS